MSFEPADPFDHQFVVAAHNTIKAKWWQVVLATWFGKRVEASRSGYAVVAFRWRGRLYLVGEGRVKSAP